MKTQFNMFHEAGLWPNALPGKSVRAGALLIAVAWLIVVCGGLWLLARYENTPGPLTQPPQQWPVASHIRRSPDRATLVMLVHPQCPCTRASMGELGAIMAHSQGRLTAFVLFLQPTGFTEDWVKTDLWKTAASIPGVNPILDGDGYEARVFHALTSGQTALYDQDGKLIFSGGITASRGHFGDNAGEMAIVALVNSKVPEQTETKVYGCPLFAPNSECPVLIDESNKR